MSSVSSAQKFLSNTGEKNQKCYQMILVIIILIDVLSFQNRAVNSLTSTFFVSRESGVIFMVAEEPLTTRQEIFGSEESLATVTDIGLQ